MSGTETTELVVSTFDNRETVQVPTVLVVNVGENVDERLLSFLRESGKPVPSSPMLTRSEDTGKYMLHEVPEFG